MKIAKTSKLGMALAVLKKIELEMTEVGVDMYSNCREQGFFVKSCHDNPKNKLLDRLAVSFAEHRSSDDIIVQYGKASDFNDYGAFNTDEKYETCKEYFRYNDSAGAAKFITKWLKGEI